MLIDIVGTGEQGNALVAIEFIKTEGAFIAIIRTATHHGATEITFTFVLFQFDIDRFGTAAIIDLGEFGLIAHIIKNLNRFDHISGDILGSQFRVGTEKLFTINIYFLDILALGGHIAIFIYLHAR